jgi:hypothetical protein
MEIFFDLYAAGSFHEDGYVVQGGPGRAIFDRETKAFKRMEPLGGLATGGVITQSGWPIVGEPGPSPLTLPPGSVVSPQAATSAGDAVQIREVPDIDTLLKTIQGG